MRNSLAVSMVMLFAVVAFLATAERPAAQRGRITGEGFITEGVPKMPNPPGPAPKRDLSGAWVGPQNNKPDPMPPMTPAGQAAFKTRSSYGAASRLGARTASLARRTIRSSPAIRSAFRATSSRMPSPAAAACSSARRRTV